MSVQCQTIAKQAAGSPMGFFERYLTLWVLLCIVAGIMLGRLLPALFHSVGGMQVAQVNLPVAVLIWIMIIPMLLKIDLRAISSISRHWRGMLVTLFVNWAVKPFSMALLAWLFIGVLFKPWLPADQINSFIAGLIILAAAPCTAMVFVWSLLARGEPAFTLSQVAINDLLMIIAFAPIVGLLLGLSAISVPWSTLLISVCLYIIFPLIIANILRAFLLRRPQGDRSLQRLISTLHIPALSALLLMLVLLFGFQGGRIVAQPLVILLLAIPIVIQVYFNSTLAYLLNRAVRSAHCVAGPSALIGASNFF